MQMKKIKIKIPAKVNLNLDILGVENGFHTLKTLVCSIDLYDEITLSKREDELINVKMQGLPLDCPPEKNNAYKTAELFLNRFSLNGVDITIDKKIPVCGGLGGSSADIVGVLKGLRKLYNINADIYEIANQLGSDTAYMLNGGTAVLSGRGERVERVKIRQKFHLLMISEPAEVSKKVSAKECYAEFDRQGIKYTPTTDIALRLLKTRDSDNFFKVIKNDLYPSAVRLLPEIKENLECLSKYAPAVMTGSGSTVLGIFKSKAERDRAFEELFPKYGEKLIKAKIIK